MESKSSLFCDIAVNNDVNEPNETLSDPIKATVETWRYLRMGLVFRTPFAKSFRQSDAISKE